MDYESAITDAGLRHQSDPSVDRFFDALICGEDQGAGRSFINLSNQDQLSVETRACLDDYFSRYSRLPSFADSEAIERGAKLFGEYGPQIVVSLFCNALPACYSCPNGADILVNTGRLLRSDQENFTRYTRRIMETAQFVMNVMAPNAFSDGSAIRSTLQIRLIHSSIRHHLRKNGFDTLKNGQPINQQDLLGTLMSFSYLSIDTLLKLGVKLSAQQKHDFLHIWNVVGYLLGIKIELLPKSIEEAEFATHSILQQQMRASDSGRLLTHSLLTFMSEVLWRDMFKEFAPFMVRYLSGVRRANLLGIPDTNPWLTRMAIPMMRFVMRHYQTVLGSNSLLNQWVQRKSRLFLQALIIYYNAHREVEFKVPLVYQKDWLK